MRVQIVLFDGCDELDALAPFEVLRRAGEAGADIQTKLVTLTDMAEVTAAYGLRVRPTGRLEEGELPDLVLVPGGGWNHRGLRGARVEAERGALPAALARLHAAGMMLAGVCTGAMLIAAAHLLIGRHATTHHLALDELQAAGATVIHARVVDDGDLLTSGGVTSGIDLALWLVERFAGPQVALQIERRLEYERRGTVWRRLTAS